MAVLYTPHFAQFFDDDGNPLSGGFLYTYAAGTNTPKATYTTAAASVEMPNPIELDAGGRARFFIAGSYKYVLHDADGNPVNNGTTDNVTSFTALAASNPAFYQTFSGDNSTTGFVLSSNLGTDEKALMIFIDPGLGKFETNGDFATDTGWTKGAGWSISGGVANAVGAISTALSQTAALTLVAGQSYTVTMTITRDAGSITPNIGGTAGTARSAAGTYSETIIAGSTQTLSFTTSGFTGTVDNVTVKRVMSSGPEIQPPTAFTVNGTALSFAVAPPTGVNNIYVFAPSLLLGAASAAAEAAAISETNAAAHELTAQAWASKTDGQVAATDYSAKAYAIGGTGVTGSIGAAKEWATLTSGAVDGASAFSAKEYAQGTQASTGGSAKNWAQQTGGDVTGAAANSRSAKSWAQDTLTGATLGGSSKDWALTTGGTVNGTEFSAKEYAIGTTVTTGSAKDWATKTAAAVVTGEYSAKDWAVGTLTRGAASGGSAKDWATYTGGAVDGTEFSAKKYAQDAATSASSAANYAAALSGTSTTSLTIGTGTKVFTTQANKAWVVGQRLRAASDDGTKIMDGEVTDYTTTSLTLSVDYTESSGTHADWNISLVGARGATGPAGSVADGTFGDIVVTSSGSVWTVGNSAISNAKMANMNGNTLKGNATGSAAAPTDIALAANTFVARSSAGNMAAKTITDFGLSIVDDADASTALSTLGVSTFIKTLLDDADAATARTTLGITGGGFVPLKTVTATNATSVDFVNGSAGVVLNGTYKAYAVAFECAPLTDGTALYYRTSTDGGSTFDSSAGNYAQARAGKTGGGSDSNLNSNSATEINIANNCGNAAGESIVGVAYLFNPAGTTYDKRVIFNAFYEDDAGVVTTSFGGGARLSTADVDGIRFVMAAGNLSGTFTLYGLASA